MTYLFTIKINRINIVCLHEHWLWSNNYIAPYLSINKRNIFFFIISFRLNFNLLVNNAGGLVKREKIAEMSLEHWQNVMDVNLTSTFIMSNAALQHMTDGAIVNLASQAGRDGGGPGAVPYATSKGAVMTMTRGLAKELGPNIRVNALCPGMIDTDFHNIHTPDAGRRGFEATAPVKRQGHVEDAANLVLFLACDDSAFMTGTNIDINGGMLFS
jgi:3-oxoacyl-[acyl-carrier protein] reductase